MRHAKSKLDARGLYYLLLGCGVLAVVLLIGGVYVANAVLQKQSWHVVANRLQTMALDDKQQQLTKARSDIARYKDLADITKSIVPQDKDQAQTIREIVNIADASGIKLGAITFPTSSLGGVAGAPAKTTLSQLTPVKNIAGVYGLVITIQSDVAAPAPYSRFITFLDSLEHNRRTALVKGVTLQPDVVNPGNVSFTLTVSEYIKP